jgi:hypothetical protein
MHVGIFHAMDRSIFTEKNIRPSEDNVKQVLGKTYILWEKIREYTTQNYPGAVEEWNYPGDKYGWSFRIKDKKRAIIYLLPRDGFFKVALVFGQQATSSILASGVSGIIKQELIAAKPYAEGRGIRIEIADDSLLKDIFVLVKIKITGQL